MPRLAVVALVGLALTLLGGCQGPADVGGSPSAYSYMQMAQANAATAPADAAAGPDGRFPLSANPSLPECLTYAALHNPGLEAAFNRFRAALERIPQEKALSDPQFSYRYYIVEQMMADGQVRHVYAITQEFPWLAKLQLKGDIAAREAAAEYQRFQAARLKLANEVKGAFYELYYVTRSIGVIQENQKLLGFLESAARARYEAAAATHPDLIRAQLELGKLDNELRTTKDMLEPGQARLNAAMGRPADAPLPPLLQAPPLDVDAARLDQAELLALLAQSNPELKSLAEELAGKHKAVEMAGKSYLPDFMLGFEYGQMFQTPDSRGQDPNDQKAIMFGMSIPIWWDKYAAGVREARLRSNAAELERKDKTNLLWADLKMALYRLRDANRRVSLYRQVLVPRAQQSLRAVESAYRSGGAGFNDMIDLQRMLLEFQLSAERALVDQAQRLAEVEMLVGRELPQVWSGASSTQPHSQPARQAATQPARPATE